MFGNKANDQSQFSGSLKVRGWGKGIGRRESYPLLSHFFSFLQTMQFTGFSFCPLPHSIKSYNIVLNVQHNLGLLSLTRMHSSRMRTGRSLTVCRSLLRGGCTQSQGCTQSHRGCTQSGGVLSPGGCTQSQGVYLVLGVYLVPGSGLTGGVSDLGGV